MNESNIVRVPFSQPITPARTAVLVVDLQNGEISQEMKLKHPEFVKSIEDRVVPNVQRLLAAARSTGVEVVYTVIQSLTQDGRDRSALHKLAKLHYPPGSWEASVIPEIAPQGDEIVLPKTGSGVFGTTMIEYVLRNMGIESIVVVGVVTDQCVDMAVRAGSDKGFHMICASDACASYSSTRHDSAVEAFGAYARISRTEDLASEFAGMGAAPDLRRPRKG